MELRADSLRVGDRLPGPFGGVVTAVELPRKGEQYVKVWVDHKFVPKCYLPGELVHTASPPTEPSA